MGRGPLGFARRGPQHRPSRRPRGGQEPRHAGRGRVVGIRRGAAVQAARPLGYGGDAAAGVRGDGPAGCGGRPVARGGPAPAGGAAARRGPRARGCGPACGAPRGAAPVLAHPARRARGPARSRVRSRPARRACRVRRGAAPREPRPGGAGGRRARREGDARRCRVRAVRRRVHRAAPTAGRFRRRHAPRLVPGHRRRGVRVAGGAARSPARLMPLLDGFDLTALARELGALGADGWLLYDFRKVNPIPGRTLAIETSLRDQVPYLDRVPHGVVQLLESFGARLVSSAPLVSRFAARWSVAELAGHRKAAEVLARVARDSLAWTGSEAARGAEVRETGVKQRVLEAIERAGLWTNEGPIVAFGPTSAMPHYEPHPGADRRLAAGDVILLDLWAGPGQGSVFADQTWIGFAGRSPDTEVRRVWKAVKGARDAAVRFLRERWRPDGAVTGAQVDDAARAVIRDAGLADYFLHRTGHSIDRDLHGSGPHIDNFETEDARALVAGVGFSIEPGVYLPERFGMRSEINVYMDSKGPEVNPSHPQDELILV